jgi:hypothetical protein
MAGGMRRPLFSAATPIGVATVEVDLPDTGITFT